MTLSHCVFKKKNYIAEGVAMVATARFELASASFDNRMDTTHVPSDHTDRAFMCVTMCARVNSTMIVAPSLPCLVHRHLPQGGPGVAPCARRNHIGLPCI